MLLCELPNDDLEPRRDARARERTLEFILGLRFEGGNQVDVLQNGDAIFAPMLRAIDQAQKSIAFVTFVFWQGDIARRFAHALRDAAKRGVEVKVVLDAVGASSMSDELVDEMNDAGVDVRWFRPKATLRVWRTTHRTHRKLLITDHKIAFTGGVGIAQEWTGDARDETEWRDTHFRIRGPAVIGLWAAFADNWVEMTGSLPLDCDEELPAPQEVGETRALVVKSTASVGWSDITSLVRVLFGLAERRIAICTPYLMPDSETISQLCDAARAGLEVEIMVPGQHTDQRLARIASEGVVQTFLEAGVRILEFEPTMMHTKVILIDDDLACVGSANLNHRSLRKDDEVAVVISDSKVVAELDEAFQQDAERCHDKALAKLGQRAWWRRLLAFIVRPFRGEM